MVDKRKFPIVKRRDADDRNEQLRSKIKVKVAEESEKESIAKNLFDENENDDFAQSTSKNIIHNGLDYEDLNNDFEEGESSSKMNEEKEDENDILDAIIPSLESIQSGIYMATITSVKVTKNQSIMMSFNLNVENQFYYPIFAFFSKVAIKGNTTYLLLNAFDDESNSFNSLIKRKVVVSVRVVKKDGKIYENIVDFANSEYEIDELEVDDYGRFTF